MRFTAGHIQFLNCSKSSASGMPCAMDHAMDPAESPMHLSNGLFHLIKVADIGAEQQNLGSELGQGLQLSNLAAYFVAAFVGGQPLRPSLFRREGRLRCQLLLLEPLSPVPSRERAGYRNPRADQPIRASPQRLNSHLSCSRDAGFAEAFFLSRIVPLAACHNLRALAGGCGTCFR